MNADETVPDRLAARIIGALTVSNLLALDFLRKYL